MKYTHKIYVQYDLLCDCNIIRVDTRAKDKDVHMKTAWRDWQQNSKVIMFLGNWHKWAGTEQEDILWEMAEIIQKVEDIKAGLTRYEFNQLLTNHPDGYMIMPLELIGE